MPDTPETAGELFRAGQLTAAIEAANTAVRNNPADFARRLLLAELLVFAGNLQRADVILDAAAKVDPTTAVVTAEFRQLVRADTARRQCMSEGRVPEFLGEPTEAMRAALAARVALRAGDVDAIKRHAAEAEAARPRVAGTFSQVLGTQASGTQASDTQASDDIVFDDFRDADDLYAGFFEVLTTTGKYFWIPTERVASIELHPPRRPRDLAWRRATISVTSGPDGEVYLPALYLFDQPAPSDDISLGRATDWLGDEDGLMRGIGQRVFLIGDDAYGITELSVLRFTP
jgi:type VI secretion system protein ImpE